MKSVNDALQLVAVIVAIAAAVGVALVFVRSNLTKTQIENLRNWNQDQANHIAEQDKKILDLENLHEIDKVKIQHLETMVTGKEQLNQLMAELANHDRRVDERHETLSNTIHSLVESNNALVRTFLEAQQS